MENNTISWDYPKQLMDNEGYPTSEALDYIRNWSFYHGRVGQYFGEGKYEELIEYIKSIWAYNDAIVYEDGLLEIHTYGWSGNEDIIEELKHTNLWLMRHRATQTGGHYYFKIDKDSEFDYWVTKQKN